MDRKTATAMTYVLLFNRMAKAHGITDPEEKLILAIMTIISSESVGVSFGTTATALTKATADIVESEKYVLAAIKKYVADMQADPTFVKTIEDKAAKLGV